MKALLLALMLSLAAVAADEKPFPEVPALRKLELREIQLRIDERTIYMNQLEKAYQSAQASQQADNKELLDKVHQTFVDLKVDEKAADMDLHELKLIAKAKDDKAK